MDLFDVIKKKSTKDPIIKCPRCDIAMLKKSRQGLTIDKCRKCGGIWLDKGEIQKIALRFSKSSDKVKPKIIKKTEEGDFLWQQKR